MAIAGLLAVCVSLSTANPALALERPEVVAAAGGNAVTWNAAGLPEGWGYKVAVAKCQEFSCAEPKTQYFEVEKIANSETQSFVPYAQNITNFELEPLNEFVYIGVAVLQDKGKGPITPYSAPRTKVQVKDGPRQQSGVLEAPPLLWVEGESADWNSVRGTEWGYKIAVSDKPRCFPLEGPKCRTTETFDQPITAVNPQSFIPCLGRLKFTPTGGTVYLGVGTLKAPATNPASFTGSEVAVKASECAPPVVANPSATSIALTSAALSGTVDPKGSNIKSCYFEYGATGAYGASVECSKLPSGEGSAPVTATLVGLAPETEYHFRLVAQGDLTSRAALSGDMTFMTTTPPPVNISPPTINGLPIAGLSLAGGPGVWEHHPAYSYQWERCSASGTQCGSINGATASTILLSSADVGHRVRLTVVAQNRGGAAQASSSLSLVVGATVQAEARWGVEVFGALTLVESVEILNIPAGARVEVTCQGHGCPFHSKQITSVVHKTRCRKHHCHTTHVAPSGQIDLGFPFQHRRLQRGVVLSVRVVKTGWIGRETKIVLRANRPPKKSVLCLAPGSRHVVQCPS
jgi:hypothetical protein